jgi:hypothetical protein
MPLRTTAAKALAQIEHRDPNGAAQYRAELKYFHVPQRAILGMTNAYEVADEAFVITDDQLAEHMAVLEGLSEDMATQQGIPLHLLPHRQPPSVPHPHALPPS